MNNQIFWITGIKPCKSRFGGMFFYVFLRSGEPKSGKTCIDPKNRNYAKWGPFLRKFEGGEEVFLKGIRFKGEGLIDADSPIHEARAAV